MNKDKQNKIILFIRFLKEKELYEIIHNKMTIRHFNMLNEVDRMLSLPHYFYTLIGESHTDELIAQWEEFYLYHIHNKTKIQVLKEAIKAEDFNTLIHDINKQKKYTSIESVLKYNTLCCCIDRALTWNKTESGSNFYMNIYRNVNDYIVKQYKDLYYFWNKKE